MVELGELDANKGEFAKRSLEVVAISVDGAGDSKTTQERFPSLKIVSDSSQSVLRAFDLIDEAAGPGGNDVATPTIFVVDGKGVVRFVYRSTAVPERIAVADLLVAADEALGGEGS